MSRLLGFTTARVGDIVLLGEDRYRVTSVGPDGAELKQVRDRRYDLLVGIGLTLALIAIAIGLSLLYAASTGWFERRSNCLDANGVWLGREEVCVAPLEEEGRGA